MFWIESSAFPSLCRLYTRKSLAAAACRWSAWDFPATSSPSTSPASGEILLDPYHGGAILSLRDCEEKLKAQFGEEAEFRPSVPGYASTKQTLTRMLNNLKGSFFRRKDFAKVMMIIEMALAVDPGSRQEIHDRAMVYFLLRRYRKRWPIFGPTSIVPPLTIRKRAM